MKEKWVRINTIEGYEEIKDYYWLSNSDEDKIINRNTGKQLKFKFDRGYKKLGLYTIDGKIRMCRIHILKAKAFIYTPNPLDATLVRHLDDCKTNNTLINLAWGTRSNNAQDAIKNGHYNYEAAVRGLTKGYTKGGTTRAKQISKPVRCIETGVIYPSALQAERELNFPRGSISHCCSGKRKTAKGLHWEFVNKEVSSNELECEQI